MSHLFWLAPALPLGAFATLAVGLNRSGRLATGLAVVAVAGAAIISGMGLLAVLHGVEVAVSIPWLTVGGRSFTLALGLDPLGAVIAVLVSVVALIVFVYAAFYMADDPRRGRFFTTFSLFAGAMLTLVLAADLLTLFIAWELVGLCSYLLIGFWFERPGVPAAATKALLTTRLADQAMLVGVLLLVGTVGSSRIDSVITAATSGRIAPGLLLASTMLLFVGAAGKSAQVPFQGWLPDAMLGPTPVSALLHSATMVAAGVFLVARLHIVFAVARPALAIVAWVGVATALLGGAVALVQTDLKRTLAYSTMSQLGLMFVGLGVGSLLAGVLLLIAQALYKALLFLAAGVVDHAVGGTTFDRMGGLAKRMPRTFGTFAIGAAALAGLPVTLALPPKDPMLAAASRTSPALFVAALVASLLTALYSARALSLVFFGPPARPAQEAHGETVSLLAPTIGLAGLVVVGLLANADVLGRPLSQLLGTDAPESGAATALALLVAVAGVALGIWARLIWSTAVVWPPLARVAPLLRSEFGLTRLYRAISGLGLARVAMLSAFDRRTFDSLGRRLGGALLHFIRILSLFDRRVFDPLGARVSRLVRAIVRQLGAVDHRVFDAAAAWAAATMLAAIRAGARFDLRWIDAAFTALGHTLLAASQRLRWLQTGRIENYLLAVFVWGLGAIALAAIVLVLR